MERNRGTGGGYRRDRAGTGRVDGPKCRKQPRENRAMPRRENALWSVAKIAIRENGVKTRGQDLRTEGIWGECCEF